MSGRVSNVHRHFLKAGVKCKGFIEASSDAWIEMPAASEGNQKSLKKLMVPMAVDGPTQKKVRDARSRLLYA